MYRDTQQIISCNIFLKYRTLVSNTCRRKNNGISKMSIHVVFPRACEYVAVCDKWKLRSQMELRLLISCLNREVIQVGPV